MNNLKAVLAQLQSEKVRERQDGITQLKATFERDSAVVNLDKDGKGKAWLAVFQALFTAVALERTEVLNKNVLNAKSTTGNAARKRLGEAGAAVRWLAERSVDRMNRKVVNSLFSHLLNTLVYRNTMLLGPVALDYVKTLRCLVSWPPHLDHLDEDTWVRIVQLAFNVILDEENLNTELEEELSVPREDDSKMDLEYPSHDSGQDEDEQESSLAHQSKKRAAPSQKLFRATVARRTAHRPTRSVSPEQVELMTILSILLRSNAAPFLSKEHDYLPNAVLSRLRRFIEMYPSDSSLYHDCLHSISATLGHLSLNKIAAVHDFAVGTWDGLVDVMRTKNKKMKESLLSVLKVLFPYLTMTTADETNSGSLWSNGVARLWQVLEAEVGSRRGIEPLSLEALRLQLALLTDDDITEKPAGAFVAKTFRYGSQFNPSQALSWAVLELQADCLQKLLIFSESMRGSSLTSSRNDSKRARVQNPLATLLVSIQDEPQSTLRSYRLQVLLFFIDRHWSILHVDHQRAVIDLLNQYISVDDAVAQSWVFLCFAAIAYTQCHRGHLVPQPGTSTPYDRVVWDSVWTHLVRRANIVAVSRAACHAGYTILRAARHLVSPPSVLSEIETLAKDIDVQGPALPHDSVCAFLGMCLRIASQDIRLYRMQLEEKVLSWLVEVWRLDNSMRSASSMPVHAVDDVLDLLQTICGIAKRSHVVCRTLLPDCLMTRTVIEEESHSVIRDYMLNARFPPYSAVAVTQGVGNAVRSSSNLPNDRDHSSPDLIEPRARERRVSAFLLKLLEDVSVQWGTPQDIKLTAERARRDLDLVVTALLFEYCLVVNGVRNNRRVIQAACRVISQVRPLFTDGKLTDTERLSLLLGLEPLVLVTSKVQDDEAWETMLPPSDTTGIKRGVMRSLLQSSDGEAERLTVYRRRLLRLIWQSSDVQDAFNGVFHSLRDIAGVTLGSKTSFVKSTQSRSMADEDDFAAGGSRIQTPTARVLENISHDDSSSVCLDIVRSCTLVLAMAPMLQSPSHECTRDKELSDIFLDSGHAQFLAFSGPYFYNVRSKTLNITVPILDKFLDKFGELLVQYHYSRSEDLQVLAVEFLDSTSHVWLSRSEEALPPEDGNVACNVIELCRWLRNTLKDGKIRSWKTRDRLARFFDRYVAQDPQQAFWKSQPPDEEEEETVDILPAAIIPTLGSDADVRVRFRASVLNARLFRVAYLNNYDPLPLYSSITASLCRDLGSSEHMLTRLLCLGNIMVVSSAVRRGSFWHLLETCLGTQLYNAHIKTILLTVSERMGLSDLSQLFEVYASQIAYSIRQGEFDVLRFPPHLLGYADRRACADATFPAFSPTNLLAGGPISSIVHGKKLFANHCKAIQKTVEQGLWECFPDIVGHQVVFWTDEHGNGEDAKAEDLRQLLLDKVAEMHEPHNFDRHLYQRADRIIAAILRTFGDQDFSYNGVIVQALQAIGEEPVQEFRDLSRYRVLTDFPVHDPNLPSYSTTTILRSVNWVTRLVPQLHTEAVSYHLLHQLFADIQRCPLVNEQMRLLNGMLVWVATQAAHFRDATLLRTLINGATILLSQSDLARAAQSILEWAFDIYKKIPDRDPRFPNIIVRICCIAQDFVTDSRDETVSRLGIDLFKWIEGQVSMLAEVDSIHPQVLKALPAWPREPSSALASINDMVANDDLSSTLADHRMSGNKFRLVRRLREALGTVDGSRFGNTDFWRLKECIPLPESIQDCDTEAFAEMLVLAKGRIESFAIEQQASETLRSRHQRYGRKKDVDSGSHGTALAYRPVILTLLSLLDSASASRTDSAYRTLRLLLSVSSPSTLEGRNWSSDVRGELRFLQAHSVTPRVVVKRELRDLATDESLVNLSKDFTAWITAISKFLSDVLAARDPFFAQLCSILINDTEFAEEMLPILVHTVLEATRGKEHDSDARSILSRFLGDVLSLENVHTSSVRAIVDVVIHLRHFSPDVADALSYDKWLDLDYTLLSRSALKFGAYTTALLFLELSVEHSCLGEDSVDEQILYEIYSRIDEPDGFYGIKTRDLGQFLLKRFHHERQWDKAFKFHGARLEAGAAGHHDVEGIVRSLHSFGFHHLAIATPDVAIDGLTQTSSLIFNYDLGWRTETWDLPDQTEGKAIGVPLYRALRAVHRERDQRAVDFILHRGLREEIGRLRGLGDENLVEIREVARNLMCLSQVSKWRTPEILESIRRKSIAPGQWSMFYDIHSSFEFTDAENIMATRISLLRSAEQKEQRQQIGTMMSPFCKALKEVEKKCLVRLSAVARESHQLQVALNSVTRAQKLEDVPSLDVSEEFAQVLWLHKEQKLAVQLLKGLLDSTVSPGTEAISNESRALLLARLGTWTSEACLEKPTDILSRYFDPAVACLSERGTSGSPNSHAVVYQQCAMFAERQYHAILRSDDAIRWKVYMDRKTQEIKQREWEMKKIAPGTTQYITLKHEQDKAEKVLQLDEERWQRHQSALDAFIQQAVDMHSRYLEVSDEFDDDGSIRLCSLWFSNFDNEALQSRIRSALDRVPSRKFVFLSHQLAARLSKAHSDAGGQGNLQVLLGRMCREHPFHSLYQVFCLRAEQAASQSQSQSGATSRRHSSRHESPSSQLDRAIAATDIFERLRGDTSCSRRMERIEILCNASLQWAKYPIKKNSKYDRSQKAPFQVPDNLLIRQIHDLEVPVMTAETPVDPTMQYSRCVWISHYETTFETAGGVNLPKIINCIGSDGEKYKQLFKGEGGDDLRQDAVMEQVFDLVNIVLRRDVETRKRDLNVRGYKVIPLASQAGVIQFVKNTTPLQSWLFAAHIRYRPQDMTHKEIHGQLVAKRKQCGGQAEPLVSLFLEIRGRFKPVMRHYFTEKHKNPMSWFSKRLNYTRSVATTSIVGHVLGLGDRHTSNILLDNGTGQVVHIDLGIAFDQGKLLPVPERVPFRMTADMVDGMGMTGTQGVFQRCAEETLRVLRDGSEVIMTVLEVFKHDPLHSWTASELKIKRMQGESAPTFPDGTRINIGIDMLSGSADEAADRALTSVAKKLDKSLSVEYTVNDLIAQATDPVNLATIFPGEDKYSDSSLETDALPVGWGPHY
ncbi:hypothetical protein NEOLEDRAFT_1059985 [Neolentinus lepideus HHB14362 ss-1]|uniref:Serine/threonine-protein kinase Tel1 n=1 Tax=Neolentinus lepideus HHB14362 ss-1 TaxID=1314782 RepID=A0A165UB82_9AGAM|nr:hypothetical protein NEOLEDRAFT_1059985 [Neolentinus lepideus HHB14362 ss-1]